LINFSDDFVYTVIPRNIRLQRKHNSSFTLAIEVTALGRTIPGCSEVTVLEVKEARPSGDLEAIIRADKETSKCQ